MAEANLPEVNVDLGPLDRSIGSMHSTLSGGLDSVVSQLQQLRNTFDTITSKQLRTVMQQHELEREFYDQNISALQNQQGEGGFAGLLNVLQTLFTFNTSRSTKGEQELTMEMKAANQQQSKDFTAMGLLLGQINEKLKDVRGNLLQILSYFQIQLREQIAAAETNAAPAASVVVETAPGAAPVMSGRAAPQRPIVPRYRQETNPDITALNDQSSYDRFNAVGMPLIAQMQELENAISASAKRTVYSQESKPGTGSDTLTNYFESKFRGFEGALESNTEAVQQNTTQTEKSTTDEKNSNEQQKSTFERIFGGRGLLFNGFAKFDELKKALLTRNKLAKEQIEQSKLGRLASEAGDSLGLGMGFGSGRVGLSLLTNPLVWKAILATMAAVGAFQVIKSTLFPDEEDKKAQESIVLDEKTPNRFASPEALARAESNKKVEEELANLKESYGTSLQNAIKEGRQSDIEGLNKWYAEKEKEIKGQLEAAPSFMGMKTKPQASSQDEDIDYMNVLKYKTPRDLRAARQGPAAEIDGKSRDAQMRSTAPPTPTAPKIDASTTNIDNSKRETYNAPINVSFRNNVAPDPTSNYRGLAAHA